MLCMCSVKVQFEPVYCNYPKYSDPLRGPDMLGRFSAFSAKVHNICLLSSSPIPF